MFGALAFGNIQQKTLISADRSVGVAPRRRRFNYRADFSVLAFYFKLEIADRTMFVQEFFHAFAVGGIHIEMREVYTQQLFTVFVTQHAHQGVVKIQKVALRGGNKYTVTTLGN